MGDVPAEGAHAGDRHRIQSDTNVRFNGELRWHSGLVMLTWNFVEIDPNRASELTPNCWD